MCCLPSGPDTIRKRAGLLDLHLRPEIREPHRKRLTFTSTSLVRKSPLANFPTTMRIAPGHCIVDDASRTRVGYHGSALVRRTGDNARPAVATDFPLTQR